MEKYRQFADHATGVSPFVPIQEVRRYGAAAKMQESLRMFLTGPLLLMLRLPLLSALLFWIVVVEVLSAFLSFVPGAGAPLSGALRGLCIRPSARVCLVLMGFYSVEQAVWPVVAPHLAAKRPKLKAGAGDVIMANLASYVDVLVHSAEASPLFAFATDDAPGCSDVKIVVKDTLGALLYATTDYGSAQEKARHGVDIATAVRKAAARGVPLLLFFEGTTTNGRGVLPPPGTLLSGLSAEQRAAARFLVVSTRYERPRDVAGSEGSQRWSVAYPVGPLRAHLFGLLSRPAHVVIVSRPSGDQLPTLTGVGGDAQLLLRQLVTRMCDSADGKLAKLSRTRSDKRAFLQHWHSTQGTGAAAYSGR